MTSKQVWVARIAVSLAGHLGASWPGEILGYTEQDADEMSEAEYDRLTWATEEVRRRLYKMGHGGRQ